MARFLVEHLADPPARRARHGARRASGRADRAGRRRSPAAAALAGDPRLRSAAGPPTRSVPAVWGTTPRSASAWSPCSTTAGARPRRNTWVFFGSCAGSDDWAALVQNLLGVLRTGRSTIEEHRLLAPEALRLRDEGDRRLGRAPGRGLLVRVRGGRGGSADLDLAHPVGIAGAETGPDRLHSRFRKRTQRRQGERRAAGAPGCASPPGWRQPRARARRSGSPARPRRRRRVERHRLQAMAIGTGRGVGGQIVAPDGVRQRALARTPIPRRPASGTRRRAALVAQIHRGLHHRESGRTPRRRPAPRSRRNSRRRRPSRPAPRASAHRRMSSRRSTSSGQEWRWNTSSRPCAGDAAPARCLHGSRPPSSRGRQERRTRPWWRARRPRGAAKDAPDPLLGSPVRGRGVRRFTPPSEGAQEQPLASRSSECRIAERAGPQTDDRDWNPVPRGSHWSGRDRGEPRSMGTPLTSSPSIAPRPRRTRTRP
jgi:hypothetical protein